MACRNVWFEASAAIASFMGRYSDCNECSMIWLTFILEFTHWCRYISHKNIDRFSAKLGVLLQWKMERGQEEGGLIVDGGWVH